MRSVEEARDEAREKLEIARKGKDPRIEQATKRAVASVTFSAVMADYLAARQRDMKPRSHEETARHLRQHWAPLHGLALEGITRQLVAKHLRQIIEARGPVAANRAVRHCLQCSPGPSGRGMTLLTPWSALTSRRRHRASAC